MSSKSSHSQSKIHPHPTHVGHVIHEDEKSYKKDGSVSGSHSQSQSSSAEATLTDILDPLDTLIYIYYGELIQIRNEEGKVLFHMVSKQTGTLWDPEIIDYVHGYYLHEGRGEVPLYDYLLVTPENKILLYLKRHASSVKGTSKQQPAYQIYIGQEEKVVADLKYYSDNTVSSSRYWVSPMSLFSGATGKHLITAQGDTGGCCTSFNDSVKFFSPALVAEEAKNNPQNINNNNTNKSGQSAQAQVGEMRKDYKTRVNTLTFKKELPVLHKICVLAVGWRVCQSFK